MRARIWISGCLDIWICGFWYTQFVAAPPTRTSVWCSPAFFVSRKNSVLVFCNLKQCFFHPTNTIFNGTRLDSLLDADWKVGASDFNMVPHAWPESSEIEVICWLHIRRGLPHPARRLPKDYVIETLPHSYSPCPVKFEKIRIGPSFLCLDSTRLLLVLDSLVCSHLLCVSWRVAFFFDTSLVIPRGPSQQMLDASRPAETVFLSYAAQQLYTQF